MKIAQSSPKGLKTPWEKKKLLFSINFSFSLSVFKRLVLQRRKKPGLVWERVNKHLSHGPDYLERRKENILRKGENAVDPHFLLLPQFFFFLSFQRKSYYMSNDSFSSAKLVTLYKSKINLFYKE